MYDRLNERYQNERRSKEPRQISKNSNKSIPTSAELRIPSLINENKKLQQTIESMKETESFHIQEISSQRKQIEQLMNQQTQLLSKQTNFNDTASTITTMNISTSSRENENEQENEKIIKELKSKIEELQAESSSQERPNFELAEKLLANGWEAIYATMSREEKQEFWRILVKEIIIFPDRHIEYSLNE